MQPIREAIDAVLLRGAFGGHSKLVGMCRPLYDHRERLWTSVDVNNVDPTNNASERALRSAMIWRKLSYRTQSARGRRFVETIPAVLETGHRQSTNSFEYLTDTIQDCFADRPRLSLLAGGVNGYPSWPSPQWRDKSSRSFGCDSSFSDDARIENATMPADDSVVTLCNGDIRIWVEQGSSLHIKCVTKYGDPVELNSEEAGALCDVLRQLSHRIS